MEIIDDEKDEVEKVNNENDNSSLDTSSKEDNNSQKKFFLNVSIVLLSNVFSAISGILIGFVVPKFLSIADYGYYKTFTLYSSYIGLLHFGFIDGIFLMYAGKKYNEINKEKFRTYTRFLMLIETLISSVVVVISLFFLNTELFLIFIFVALNILLTNLTSYFEFMCQATMQFKKKAFRKFIMCILNIISVVALFLLYHFEVAQLTGSIYIIITLLINLLIVLWYLISFREIIFGKSAGFNKEKGNIWYLIKIGFPVLLTSLITQFIFVIDQQIVNIFFDKEIYATYAFAYNMLNVITIATSAISVVFYPTIKSLTEEKIIKNYSKINEALLIFLAFCLFAYFMVDIIVRVFLEKYIDSLPIFKIVIPGVVVSSCITSIKYNCYKALNKANVFFVTSIIILVISGALDIIVYLIFKDPVPIAIASIVCLFIWYILSDIFMAKKYKISWVKNLIYLILTCGAFYGVSYLPNFYLGMILYLPIIGLITFIMYRKDIINIIMKYKNNRKMKKGGNI